MLTVNPSPTQFDKPISTLATKIYIAAINILSSDAVMGYDRCYTIKKDKVERPHYRVGKDYKEVLFDDKKSVMFFFGVGDEVKYSGAWGEVDVHLVFMVDINKVGLGNDVETRKYFFDVLRIWFHGFTLQSEVFGFDKTFQGYNGMKDTEAHKFDIHPRHCFRFNFKLRFPIKY